MTSKLKKSESAGARKDIQTLFALAKEVASNEQELADRYVFLARKMASRGRISLRAYNRVHCSCYFTSRTLRVRTRPDKGVLYTCLRCGHVTRIRTIPRRKSDTNKES